MTKPTYVTDTKAAVLATLVQCERDAGLTEQQAAVFNMGAALQVFAIALARVEQGGSSTTTAAMIGEQVRKLADTALRTQQEKTK